MTHYFAEDGNYGSAENMIIVHTDDFNRDDWEQIETAPDSLRMEVVKLIIERKAKQKPVRLIGL